MPTLTTAQIVLDVIKSFKNRVPAIKTMSRDFRTTGLKLNKTYTGHIASVPTVSTFGGNYKTGAQSARGLLTDVDITVDNHKHVTLLFEHLNAIKDDKQEYQEVIDNAGYALAKDFCLSVMAKVTDDNLTNSLTYTTANSDYDMLNAMRDQLNSQAAAGIRYGLVNTSVASSLGLDDRIINNDYSGRMSDADQAYRIFRGHAGFSEVIEFPDLPSNAGTAVTISGIEADDEVVTTATAHGLSVGDRVQFQSLAGGGAGLTDDGTTYWVASVPTATTLTVSATDGGSAVNVTTDYTGGTISRVQNLTGVFFDPRALVCLAGVPEDHSAAREIVGAPATSNVTVVTDPDPGSDLSMMAIAEQEQGTLDGYLAIAMVWGSSVGAQGGSAGSLTDNAGVRLVTA